MKKLGQFASRIIQTNEMSHIMTFTCRSVNQQTDQKTCMIQSQLSLSVNSLIYTLSYRCWRCLVTDFISASRPYHLSVSGVHCKSYGWLQCHYIVYTLTTTPAEYRTDAAVNQEGIRGKVMASEWVLYTQIQTCNNKTAVTYLSHEYCTTGDSLVSLDQRTVHVSFMVKLNECIATRLVRLSVEHCVNLFHTHIHTQPLSQSWPSTNTCKSHSIPAVIIVQ